MYEPKKNEERDQANREGQSPRDVAKEQQERAGTTEEPVVEKPSSQE